MVLSKNLVKGAFGGRLKISFEDIVKRALNVATHNISVLVRQMCANLSPILLDTEPPFWVLAT